MLDFCEFSRGNYEGVGELIIKVTHGIDFSSADWSIRIVSNRLKSCSPMNALSILKTRAILRSLFTYVVLYN